jgi:hypothetical protein
MYNSAQLYLGNWEMMPPLGGVQAPLERHESLLRRPRSHHCRGRRITPEKSKEQIWVDWVAKQGGDNFQEMLNAHTEDRHYQILAQLLSLELEQLKIAPRF